MAQTGPTSAATAGAARTLLDARAFERTLTRMANEILELNAGTDALVLVGIQRRGVQRLQVRVGAVLGVAVAVARKVGGLRPGVAARGGGGPGGGGRDGGDGAAAGAVELPG